MPRRRGGRGAAVPAASTFVSTLHEKASELQCLFEQLGSISLSKFMQTNKGWKAACALWLSLEPEVKLGGNSEKTFNLASALAVLYVTRYYTSLRRLEIYNTRPRAEALGDEALLTIPLRLTHLEHLVLVLDTQMKHTTFHAIATGCPQLRHVQLAGLINDIDVVAFALGCPLLESLLLPHSRSYQTYRWGSVYSIANKPCTSVDLSDTCLLAIGHMSSLRSLNLAGQDELTAPRLTEAFSRNVQLTSLNLSCCKSLGMDGALVSVSQRCPQLQRLTVSCCPFTDVGTVAVASGCPLLIQIDISGVPHLTDATLVALAGLQHLTHLAARGGAGGCGYYGAPQNFTERGIQAIASGCPKLQQFQYSSLHLDARILAAVDALRQQRPNLAGIICCDSPIVLKVVSQDGHERFFKMRLDTKLEKLMRAFCQREGIDIHSVRFLFDGHRIRENRTPMELEMEESDIIDVVVEQVARDWSPTIMVPALVERVLRNQLPAEALSEEDVAALSAKASGPHVRASQEGVVLERQLLDRDQCLALARHAEAAHMATPTPDLKIPMSCEELGSLIGTAPAAHILEFGAEALRATAAASGPPCIPNAARLLLRRRCVRTSEQELESVGFHRDQSRVVLNIALNEAFKGGKLLIAQHGRLVSPCRATGMGIAHSNPVVHAVTCLRAGVRLTLLAAFD